MSGSQEYMLRFQAHICVHHPVTTNSTVLVVVGDEKRSQLGTVAGWPPCCLASPCNPPPLSATPSQRAHPVRGFTPHQTCMTPTFVPPVPTSQSSPDLSASNCTLAVGRHLIRARKDSWLSPYDLSSPHCPHLHTWPLQHHCFSAQTLTVSLYSSLPLKRDMFSGVIICQRPINQQVLSTRSPRHLNPSA